MEAEHAWREWLESEGRTGSRVCLLDLVPIEERDPGAEKHLACNLLRQAFDAGYRAGVGAQSLTPTVSEE